MTSSNTDRLIKLGDTDRTVADPAEDIRGRDVKDSNGEDIGKVSGLLIDEAEGKVRLVEIASGGFLGIGKDTTFIPVDAIAAITDEEVRIGQTRENVSRAPSYDPELVSQRDTYEGLFGYYGYAPFWGLGYAYPAYPHYR